MCETWAVQSKPQQLEEVTVTVAWLSSCSSGVSSSPAQNLSRGAGGLCGET